MNDESSNWRKDNPQGNVFTGDVSSVSGPSSIPIAPVDPNIFKWSQFLVGLLLIPIFTGFLMSFSAFSAENTLNDQDYYDYSEDYWSALATTPVSISAQAGAKEAINLFLCRLSRRMSLT